MKLDGWSELQSIRDLNIAERGMAGWTFRGQIRMKSKYKRRLVETGKYQRSWSRTKHRLTISPRALAREIMGELRVGSTAIVRCYEEHGYELEHDESVVDLITRTVQAHVIFGDNVDEEE